MIFSVIIPTYNRYQFLEKCLGSVLAQDFDFREYEVVVVNNGSTDETRQFLDGRTGSLTRIFHQEKNTGPAAARNLGAKESRGQFLAFTDDDCWVPKSWLQELFRGLNQWPKAAAVGGFLEAPDEILKTNILAKLEAFETHKIYKAGQTESLGGFESPAGGTNNIAYRRDVFEKLGGFDESFPVPAGEDADLKWRAVKAGYPIGYVPVKVTHLDPYSWRSFWRRSIRSGIGSVYFERKNFVKADNWLNLSMHFLKLLVRLPISLLFSRSPDDWRLRAGFGLKELLMVYGRFIVLGNLCRL